MAMVFTVILDLPGLYSILGVNLCRRATFLLSSPIPLLFPDPPSRLLLALRLLDSFSPYPQGFSEPSIVVATDFQSKDLS
jgi:hypothetical protein